MTPTSLICFLISSSFLEVCIAVLLIEIAPAADDDDVIVPFGWGLSYTTFSLGNANATASASALSPASTSPWGGADAGGGLQQERYYPGG